jgi:hypothetical protein
LRVSGAAIAAGLALAFVSPSISTATPRVPKCTISGTPQIQICPVAFRAIAGRFARVVVARYSDYSNCNVTPTSDAPGENQHYVVTINWGDGTRATSGTAKRGTTCPESAGTETNPGEREPIIGVHRYRKKRTYSVSVSLTYVRGSGNTYGNCVSATPGDTTYNASTNCISFGAPVTSVASVKKR